MSVRTDVRMKPNKAEIGKRISAIMKANLLNDSKLGEISGFSRSYIADVRNGRKEPPIELLFTLQAEYKVPIAYILLGEVPAESSDIDTVEEPPISYGTNKTPYYGDIVATGGMNELFTDSSEYPTAYISAPGFEDCDGALSVTGDSMHPKIRHGDIVLCKREDKPYLFLFGEIYLVITRSYRTIKYIRRSDLRDHIKLVSENPTHDPIDIALEEVLHLYRIRGMLSRFS